MVNYTDSPLIDPDKEKDLLGYTSFSKSIANAICNMENTDGIVFSIYAEWGAGKTTCLNFIKYYIEHHEKSDNVTVIHFNPWWFSGQSDLFNQFFTELKIALGTNEKFKILREKISSFGDFVSHVPVPIVGGEFVSDAIKLIKPREKQLVDLKKEISESLENTNKRLCIIIDDIDRLPAEDIRNIFKLIKAVADFRNTIYILAFDKAIAAKALTSMQEMPGNKYLEKIIQVPLDLPIADEFSMQQYTIELMRNMIAKTKAELFDSHYFWSVYKYGIKHFLNNIRNIKRLFSSLLLTYPPVENEVNAVDFFAIETIRLFTPEIYSRIKDYPEMYIGNISGIAEDEEILKQFHNDWSASIEKEDQKYIKNILQKIFPKVAQGYGHMASNVNNTRKSLRICSSDCFDTYFRLSVPEGSISYLEIKKTLDLLNNKNKLREKLFEYSRKHRPEGSTILSVFLDRFIDFISDINNDEIPIILDVFYEIGDELILPEDRDKSFYGLDNCLRIGNIITELLKKYSDKEKCFDIIKNEMQKGKALSIMAEIIVTLSKQHGQYDSTPELEANRLVSEEQLVILRDEFVKKFKSESLDEQLKTSDLWRILLLLADIEGEDSPQKWFVENKILDNDKIFSKFMSLFLGESYGKKILNPKSLEFIIDPLELIENCESIISSSPNWLSDRQRTALESFIDGIKHPEKYN